MKFKLTVIFANILQYLIKVPSLANQDEFVFFWYMLALVDIRHSPAHLYLCQYYGYCHHGIFWHYAYIFSDNIYLRLLLESGNMPFCNLYYTKRRNIIIFIVKQCGFSRFMRFFLQLFSFHVKKSSYLYAWTIFALNPNMPQLDEFFHDIRQGSPRCAK